MEVRKTHALGGKRVDIGRRNLPAEGPDIAKAPIIRQKDDDIGGFCGRRLCVKCGRAEQRQRGQ